MMLKRYIEEGGPDKFDLVIVGGGITGAAVAYIAAARGLSVALFEKKDYGGATSAATSKLIHGGLRYLANGELKLVRESLRERRILGNIAPNFVYPLPFLLPMYRRWRGNIWKMLIGMYLYDLLSYDKKDTWDKSKKLENHRLINHRKTIRVEPNLKKEDLRNAFYFFDYQSIFPERLTLAFIKSAAEYGACVSNYTPVDGFIFDEGKRITGVRVRDHFTGITREVHSSLVINCGGTWADKILSMAAGDDKVSHRVKRSEGIHIITKKIAGHHVVSLQKADGGHMMIMPWREHSLIGTTDKEFLGDPDDYRVSMESIDEIIENVNTNFGRKISREDIVHAYGGLRPLVDDQTKGSYETSRKYEVYDNAVDGIQGMITVEGGKYTTSRSLAREVLRVISAKLNRVLSDAVSDNLYLSGCEIRDMKQFMIRQHLNYKDFSRETVEYISRNYGTESQIVFRIARGDSRYAEVISHDGELLAEVVYAIQYESAMTLCDIMLRRTGTGTLGNPGRAVTEKVASLAAEMLGWDERRKEEETALLMKVYDLF
ncbi:MAG TPA: glycerol-3-phosphate dehydrogenase/oxidase [Bacteroidales bacterium]|nr:glycerol-3-phosphate dehydrogenase/oxidase [Bacteroidales bacterium]